MNTPIRRGPLLIVALLAVGAPIHSFASIERTQPETPGAATADQPLAERELKRIITPSPVNALVVIDDGKSVIAGLTGGQIPAGVWTIETGEQGRQMEVEPSVEFHTWAMALSPDGKHVFGAGCGYAASVVEKERQSRSPEDVYSYIQPTDFGVRVWDAATGKLVRTLTGHTKQVPAIGVSPDGARLATGSWDSTVRVWNVATGELEREIPAAEKPLGVTALAFTPDGASIITVANDRTVRVFSVADGAETRRIEMDRNTPALAIFPKTTRIAVGHLVAVKHFDFASGRRLLDFPFPPGEGVMNRVNAIVCSPDARWLAACNGLPTPHTLPRKHGGLADHTQEIRVWDAATGDLLLQLKGHVNAINALAYTPAGRLVSGGADCSIRVWDASVEPAPAP